MENTTIYPSSIENSGTRGSEGDEQLYKYITDGNNQKIRILNFDNEKVCPRHGIIELIPMRTTSRHQNRVNFRKVRDIKNDVIIGIPSHIDPKTKEYVFQKITLVDAETLDLSIKNDREKWAVIKNSHFLKGSPNLIGKPQYYVRDREKDAQVFLAKRIVKRKATTIAESLIGSDLVEMARNLGIGVEQNSVVTLQMAVIQKAEESPEKFMEVWDSPTRKELSVLKRALALGVVVHEPLTGITYNSIPLGSNEPMAVQFLRDNPTICNTIDLLNQKTENDSVVAMAKVDSSPIKTETDARMELMAKELEALKKQNAELAKKAMEKELSENIKVGKKDEEWEEALKKAKTYSIKGAHLMAKETLLQKISSLETGEADIPSMEN